MSDYKNILVVRTDRIGDVVLTTPALKALREKYPSAKISVLVSPTTRDLVLNNENIDQVLIDDKEGSHKGLFGFMSLVSSIKRMKFDVAVVYHTKKRTNLLCFLAGIPQRVGYKNNKFGGLLNRPIEDTRHHGKKHEAEYCLDVLKELGVESSNLDLSVSINEDSEKWVENFFSDKKIVKDEKVIVVHAGASDPSKRWPEDRFAGLIDKFKQKFKCRIILIGDESLIEVSERIISISNNIVTDMTGKTDISQIISLLKRCDLLISNDSGPVHIAAALKTPVISIFTRNQPGINPERWGPLGESSRTLKVPFSDEISYEKAGEIDEKYRNFIQINDVLEAVDSIIKLC